MSAVARVRTFPRSGARRVDREWLLLVGIASAGTTLADLCLLDRKFGLLSGGYLAHGQLVGLAERTLFVLAAALADAGAFGVVAALALSVSRWRRHRLATRSFLALSAVFLPVVWFAFVRYELDRYLGDFLSLQIVFDLSGSDPRELVAFAGGRLFGVLAATGVVLLFVLAAVRIRLRVAPSCPTGGPLLRPAAILFVVSILATTGLRIGNDRIHGGLAQTASGQLMGLLVERSTDFDGDGRGLLARPPDPAPFDPSIHPYALEIPGNGIDENGAGGDLPAGLPPYREPSGDAPSFARRPPVVLVILESFRADLIGQRHEGREVTPFLNRLASEGAFSDRAYSHNGWTVQSRYHLFTGSLAGPRGATSLIDDFDANGYQTAFFSAQDESFGDWLDVGFGRAAVRYDARDDVDKRFSVFTTPASLGVPRHVLETRVLEFLDSRRDERPLFLHLNFQDSHYPYWHRWLEPLVEVEPLRKRDIAPDQARRVRLMYLNAAANVDRALERVIGAVARASAEPPLVIAIADHGESLFEEGFLGHGYHLTEAQTRIPLIVHGGPSIAIREPFGLADVRDAIRSFLGDGGEVGRGRVFQYIGEIDRPVQIGVVTDRGRLVYDLHRRRARLGERPWRALEDLDEATRQETLELIWLWERIVRAGGHAPGNSGPAH